MRSLGLLIAAGYGRRFDPTGRTSKLECLVDGEPVAVRTARAMLGGCDDVIAVVRSDRPALADALRAAGCRIAPLPPPGQSSGPEGMGRSIACAAQAALALPGVARVLVQPADMPWIRARTIERIAALDGQGHAIVVPTHDGEDGHPVRFDAALLPGLAALSGDRGARGLLAIHPPLRIAVDDPGIRLDVDTPGDLQRGPPC